MIAQPLIAVDRIVDVDPTKIVTMKFISANASVFMGHYPHFPIYPGVFLLETMLQSLDHWIEFYGLKIALSRVKTFRLHAPALPGTVVRCTSVRLARADDLIAFEATCEGEDTMLAKAVIEYQTVGRAG